MKKRFTFFVLLLAVGMMAVAQNPYLASVNNEDEVVHLDQWQQHAARPLQAIVKLQDYSTYAIMMPKGEKATKGYRAECPAIQAVLDSFVIESVEQLCPTFVMPERPRSSASYGGGEVRDHDLSQLYLITLSPESPKREHELIAALQVLPEVEYAEPNYLVFALGEELGIRNYELGIADATAVADNSKFTIQNSQSKSGTATFNDPMYSLQWGIGACGLDSLLAAPKRDTSWRPIIAIIDTGVDTDHPDLAANIWTNPGEQNGAAGQDDDGNGFADDVHGWDFVNQTGEMHDFNSHGTHCAGIAGAVTGNGIGIAGACPDAWIMPVTVMQSDGTGGIATIVRGINYAAQNGADVISMSIGTYAYSTAMEQALAVAYQTAVLVGAAGNDHTHIQPTICGEINRCKPMFPGAFTFVLGVQATKSLPDLGGNGMLATFSNIDNDGGPSSSSYSEEQLYNYELSAPGVDIMSTVPNGGYRNYNGTSMACPLVAGGVASLMQRREYLTKEILFGDLINYSQEFYPVDFWAVYNADSIAPAILQCVTIEINDTLYGDSSMYADAGEWLQLYPTIRSLWGPADSISVWLEFQEFEDTNTLQILQNRVWLGRPISSYAKAKSINSIDIRIANNVVDGRHIRLALCATAPNAVDTLRYNFILAVTNGVKLHGMINHNDTLWPNVHYIIDANLAMPREYSLCIKPGVTLKIAKDVSINANIVAHGTPDSIITFTKRDLSSSWGSIVSSKASFKYCVFNYMNPSNTVNSILDLFSGDSIFFEDCVIKNSSASSRYFNCSFLKGERLCLYDNAYTSYSLNFYISRFNYCNVINNRDRMYVRGAFSINDGARTNQDYYKLNIFGNTPYNMSVSGSTMRVYTLDTNYFGSARENTIRKSIYDFDYPGSTTFGWIDISNHAARPLKDAHGIVWKVEVNGYDAQDEFDSIIPLGVGIHEFKVYFNRAMDTSITPILAMGVRQPYTQTSISDNASWSADSTIYTAYLNLTGRMPIDGLNRIYVSGAQDDEHFEIPYENQRFNVYVASSGSMSAGFQATPGIGKVDLEWNDQEVNYEDFLGFNVYRYQYDSLLTNYHWSSSYGQWVYDTIWGPTDTLLLNQQLLQDTMYTDFNVVPGERYYYFYKIMSTSLTENSPSKTVSCVPYSTIPGDANGSMNVDVADVITTINYVTGQNPQPFLFEAADVNGDSIINVLDIVGIINIILYPDGRPGTQSVTDQQTAIYTLENDTLYINTPVPLAGLQFTLAGCTRADVEVLPALAAFECATVEEGGSLTMIFYSMSGMTVPFGKSPLLKINNPQSTIQSIALSDPLGNNVIALNGDLLGLVDLNAVQAQFATAYPNPFSGKTRLELTVGNYSSVTVTFTDMTGRQVDSRTLATPTAGDYSLTWDATGLPHGIYFATLFADGMKAQTIKLIVK